MPPSSASGGGEPGALIGPDPDRRRKLTRMDIRFDRDDRHAVLAITGELDMATVPDLKATVDDIVPWDDIDVLTLDLCGLEFMDSSGLSALIWLRKQHPDTEIGLRASNDGMVKRLLDITAMPELFTIEIVPRSA